MSYNIIEVNWLTYKQDSIFGIHRNSVKILLILGGLKMMFIANKDDAKLIRLANEEYIL